MPSYKTLLVAGFAILAIAFPLLPQSIMTTDQARTLGLVLVTLSLWATGVVPPYLASLLFFVIALILKLAPPDVVFSGFHSAAMWLIFAGLVIAAAIKSSGLSHKIGGALLGRFSENYTLLISGIFAIAIVLSFVMPSSLGRFFLLWPIAAALSDSLGFDKASKGRSGIAIAVVFACHMPGFALLPSNVPNLILAGAAQTIYGIDLTYARYMALHFPIIGLLKSAIVVALIVRIFPDTPRPEKAVAAAASGALGWRQWYVVVVLVLTLALWMTDTLHGINPAWIGIFASVALLWPGIGPIGPAEFDKSINFSVLLFMAGFLALGAVVNVTGLGVVIAHALERILPLQPGHDFLNFVSLSVIAFIVGVISILPGVPAVLTPMAGELAELTGLSVMAVLMSQVIGFSTILFPYQSAPLMVGMQVTGQSVGKMMRVLAPLTVITALILLPLDFLWWKLLGMF
ncbi:SLC13 family permease [Martelella limonii]|uniref:SLC13 family permease n=1 Tax=Martelella limonii TaxID=1647649 RepID=UPI0015803C02|nr:SLC13 family permease [Martelella limonii]